MKKSVRRLWITGVLIAWLFVPTYVIFADRFELKNGEQVEGKVLYEDESSYYLETQGGVSNLLKSDVVRLNGIETPFVLPPQKGSAPSAEALIPRSGAEKPTSNLIAKVGLSGGVTEAELEPYLWIATQNARKERPEQLTEEEWKGAVNQAAEDEMIFLEAVKNGMLEDAHLRWRIAETFRARETAGRIRPELYADSELLAYYKAHPEEFMEPAEIKLKVLEFYPDASTSETESILKRAQRDPAFVEGWKEWNWVVVGSEPIKNVFDDHETIFGLQRGAVSGIHKSSVGMFYIFWAEDRKEAKQIPFEKARGKVKFAMINAESQELNQKLTSNLRARNKTGDTKEEELLFEEAVKENVHRQPDIRNEIISYYLDREKTTRDDLLRALRERYRVQILR